MIQALDVFRLMNGSLVRGSEPELEKIVKDEFGAGMVCAARYQEIFESRERLGERLNTSLEDNDLLDIVNGYEDIIENLCVKIFELAGETDHQGHHIETIMHTVYRADDDCQAEYARICESRERIVNRLGTIPKDKDIMLLIKGYEAIAVHLCTKMFGYGVSFKDCRV